MVIEESAQLKNILKDVLKIKNFENEFKPFDINNDKPFTFTEKDYSVKEGYPEYTNSNELGKSGTAIAKISKNTIAIYTSEGITYPKPINWNKLNAPKKESDNGNKRSIFERCHIIGYQLSARFSSPYNIFIGTDTLNHGAMLDIENEIRADVEENNSKYLYKVTPVYMFKNDIVPIGVIFEYETIGKRNKTSHCKFCFNVENGYKINYYDGSITKFEEVKKRDDTKIKEVKESSVVKDKENVKQNFYINIKDRKIHLVYNEKEKCEELKGVQRKFIQETTANYDKLLQKVKETDKNDNKKFTICEKCIKKLK